MDVEVALETAACIPDDGSAFVRGYKTLAAEVLRLRDNNLTGDAEYLRRILAERDQQRARIEELEAKLGSRAREIAALKSLAPNNSSGCSCVFDSAGEEPLIWCAAHARFRDAERSRALAAEKDAERWRELAQRVEVCSEAALVKGFNTLWTLRWCGPRADNFTAAIDAARDGKEGVR